MNLHPDWIVPDWPLPAHVRAVCTTRAGGVSQGPYASLNLGRPSGDDPACVDANRARLHAALGPAPIYLSQVHGAETLTLTRARVDAMDRPLEADACVTREPELVCSMRVADCLPVLLSDRAGTVVGAVHAGWRGLSQGVVDSAVGALRALQLRAPADTTAGPDELLAWLGPCIGPRAFEVGDEVHAAFLAQDPGCGAGFRPGRPGKWYADLPALARGRLAANGITQVYGNDGTDAWCTVGNPSRFFSHRRDSARLGGSGRMAACIWLERA